MYALTASRAFMDERPTQKDNETWKQYEESAEVMKKER
jgi:hypothetical protein